MDLGLKNKVVVVFAASRGLALASARELAKEGASLAICSRKKDSIEKAAELIRKESGAKVLASTVDVTKAEDIARFASEIEKEYGHVDILINNSGGPQPGTFDDLNEENFCKAAELLLLNVVRATKGILPLIRKGGQGGRIITITSTSVREVIVGLMLSNSLRAAVTGWSKTLAHELGKENITVNCVAPGTIYTERIEELVASRSAKSGNPASVVEEAMRAKIPLGRFGEPEEFAAAVAFLASARASYISGITLYVDGSAMASVV